MKQSCKNLTVTAFIILLLIQIGCSYDNTLYNARKYFNAAQNRPLNQSGRPTPQAIDEYNKTIQKCGYILTERKNSSEADDALFLLARALFYRGNSPYQAKDQLQSLLNNFPDSPYVHDATLYLARTLRQVNEPTEAENVLTAYLRRPETEKWHPKALLQLADFAVEDKDNDKSQFWLERLLSQYPKSVYAKEASFLLGKIYYDQKDYANSISQFQKVVDTKGISRNVKNDARYYIALNQFYLNDCMKCLNTANKLIKDEERLDKIPGIRVLIGRSLLELENESEAIELLQDIIKFNSRTLSSAEAYFRLAEYYYQKQDIQSALDNYNKVKSESANSPFVEEATQKYNALNLIKQQSAAKVEDNSRQYFDNKLDIAEKYFRIMNQADSAFAVFDRITQIPLYLQGIIDSLVVVRDSMQLEVDSLSAEVDLSELIDNLTSNNTNTSLDVETKIDTMRLASPDEVDDKDYVDFIESAAQSDTLNLDALQTAGIQDSLEIRTELTEESLPDSLLISDYIDIDENEIESQPEVIKSEDTAASELNQIQAALEDIENEIARLNEIKNDYTSEYIPFALFVKAAMIYNDDSEAPILQIISADLETDYPQNKYTQATKMMLEGKPVRLVDADLELEESLIDSAFANLQEDPDSSIVILKELTQSIYSNISNRANFRLGWYYTFEEQDTTLAKPYLDEIAKLNQTDEYYQLMSRFYNGTKYIINFAWEDTLIQEISINDSIPVFQIADSLAQKGYVDSIEIVTELPKDKEKFEVIGQEENTDDDEHNINDSILDLIAPERKLPKKPD